MKFDPVKKYGKMNVLLADLQFYQEMLQMIVQEMQSMTKTVKFEPYSPLPPALVRLEESRMWTERFTDTMIELNLANADKMQEYADVTYNLEDQLKTGEDH